MNLLKKIFGRKPAQQVRYKQKKRFTSFGNCQAHPIAQLLLLDEQFNRHFEYVPFKMPAFMLKKHDQDYVTELVSSVDLFIHQNIGEAFGKMFSTDNLLKLTKQDCQHISFPSLYFNGYTPEINYLRFIGGNINSFSDYHDINLVNNYLDKPENCYQKTLKQYQSDDYYSSVEVLSNATKSINTLREREQLCTVTISDYIEQSWREQRLFYSMNHPSNKVLNELVSQIKQQLGMKNIKIECEREFLGGSILPLYQSTQKLMNFDSPQVIKVRDKEMGLGNYLNSCVTVYEDITNAKLRHNLAHLKKVKIPMVEKFISAV